LDMTGTQSTYSDTIGVKLEDLKAMRNRFSNLLPGDLLPATKACIAWLDGEIAKGEPRATPVAADRAVQGQTFSEFAADTRAKHGLPPLTVKGETLTEQAHRIAGTGTVTINGDITLTGDVTASANLRNGTQQLQGAKATATFTGLQFKPLLNNLSDRKHSHYFKKCPYDAIDVYRVIELFEITDPCAQHALKKILVLGGRGSKDVLRDAQDVIDTMERFKDMREEDIAACRALQDLLRL